MLALAVYQKWRKQEADREVRSRCSLTLLESKRLRTPKVGVVLGAKLRLQLRPTRMWLQLCGGLKE